MIKPTNTLPNPPSFRRPATATTANADAIDSPVSRISAFVVAWLVLAYAPAANDPEVSGRIGVLESVQKRLNRIVELTARRFTVNAEHRDTSNFHRVKGEIRIEA